MPPGAEWRGETILGRGAAPVVGAWQALDMEATEKSILLHSLGVDEAGPTTLLHFAPLE